MAPVVKTPPIVEKIKKERMLEAEKAFIFALKAKRFEDALSQAEIVLALDPNNRVKLFLPLLEEKIELDAPRSEEESGDEGEEEGPDDVAEGDDDDDDDESDEDSEDDDEDDEDEGPSEAEIAILASQVDEIKLDKANLGTSAARKKLQATLARQIIGLMEGETKKQIINDDPLLQ